MGRPLKYNIRCLCAAAVLLAVCAPSACSQYPRIYQDYLDRARDAIRKQDYRSALLYLETAQSVQPESPEVLQYLNIVKHAIEERLIDSIHPAVSAPKNNAAVSTPSLEKAPTTVQPRLSVSPQKHKPAQAAAPLIEKQPPAVESPTPVQRPVSRQQIILELTDDLWERQPDMEIELALDQEILVRGRNITRYLVIAPDVVQIAREASREVIIVPQAYGKTFVHIWDAQQRWTFYIRTVFPAQRAIRRDEVRLLRQRSIDPFRLSYNTYWNSFYRGDSVADLQKQSYHMRHNFKIKGASPYGQWDAYAHFYESQRKDLDLTDYSLALTGAEWGTFKDIHARIFDANQHISDLTLPGRDFHGILVSGTTVDDRFSVTALRGRDRGTYGLLSSSFPSKDSYIEAGKLTYRPDDQRTMSLNYAHPWGDERPERVKDNIFSVQFGQRGESWNVYSEVGYDEDLSAQIASLRRHFDESSLFIKIRNIPPDYITAVGSTANRGEAGTQFTLSHQFREAQIRHYLDLYRDRLYKNPENEDAVNIDYHFNLFQRLSDRDSAAGNLYFIHTPGTLADRTDIRLAGTYSRQITFFNIANAQMSSTASYQRTRSDTSSFADYDRTGWITYFSLPLTRHLTCNAGYEIYYVDDVANDVVSYPRAFHTGLSYYQTLTEKWRLNAHMHYRDEQRTEAKKSFMAGQDSLSISSGVDYSPRSGMNIYLDGRAREVWTERPGVQSYVEADIRLGMRSEWDLGFSWNPKGIIQGYVFRDTNRNGIKDDGEPGIPGVRVNIGNGHAVTDQTGWYYKQVRAKMVQVSLDINTMPHGYLFTDSADKQFLVEHQQFYNGHFPLTTQSGIYGVVYLDKNENGRPDNSDEFLPKVKLILNNERQVLTDAKGTYSFYNIPEGRHVLSIDLNSLPIQYLPSVPLTNTFDVADGATHLFHIPVRLK